MKFLMPFGHLSQSMRLAVAMVAAALLSLVLPSLWLYIATSVLVMALMAHAVGLLSVNARLILLAAGSFSAIGAWVCASLAIGASWPFPVAALAGSAVAGLVGALVGLPSLRVRGELFAVLTLCFMVAADAELAIVGFPGAQDFTPVPRPSFAEGDFTYFLFVVAAFWGAAQTAIWIANSRWGVGWRLVGASERHAAALGLSAVTARLGAFVWSAVLCGLAGGLLAGQVGVLNQASFNPLLSFVIFALAVTFQTHRWPGALVAGAVLLLVPEFMRRMELPQDVADFLFAVGCLHAVRSRLQRLTPSTRGNTTACLPSPVGSKTVSAHSIDNPVLTAQGIGVAYGAVRALHQVTFSLKPGELVALIGPNGAGKTTLLDALTGFVPSVEGEVFLGRNSLAGKKPNQRARLGLRRTFQAGSLVTDLELSQYLHATCGASRKSIETQCLPSLLWQGYVTNLPSTARKLAEAVIAAGPNPQVLLMDEPAAGLNEAEKAQLADWIEQLPALLGCAVLLIEHDLSLVRRVASRLLVLDGGRLIAEGPTEAVLARPDVRAAYLGITAAEVVCA